MLGLKMMKDVIEIGNIKIGRGQDVFVVAEIGINHNGDFDIARQLIDKAKWARADAVKLQTYITEKRTPKDSPIFDILKECELSFGQQQELFEYARDKDIGIFSTPFDDESIDFLSSVNILCYKIASFDLVNKRFLRKVAAQDRPVIMSTGMANQEEIDTAVNIMQESDLDIVLLHCISAYPVPSPDGLYLDTIRALKERYHCPVGFSDHTMGVKAAKYAVASGANVIEKHFTLSKKSKGPDHSLSTEPEEMKDMIQGIRAVSGMMGEAVWSTVPAEKDILQYRRVS